MRRSSSFFKLFILLHLCTTFASAQNRQTIGGLISPENNRIGVARAGRTIFSDRPFIFDSIPKPLQNTHFIIGSFNKGVAIEMVAPGDIFAVTPLRGNAGSQEDALVAKGFTKVNGSSFRLAKENNAACGLFIKNANAADLFSGVHSFNGWVVFFYASASLPSYTTAANIVWMPDSAFHKDKRQWQGCPTIEKTGKRFWTSWFTGGPKEPAKGNYAVVNFSNHYEKNWTDPAIAIIHPNEKVRVMDPQLWKDPKGRLWMMWVQNTGTQGFDGNWGTWAAVIDNPTSKHPEWSEPRRLCDGLTRNKPTVLSSGEWLLPSYNWIEKQSTVYVSKDEGKTWSLQGGPLNDKITFWEHMLVEKKDKSIWLLQRSIKESISYDKGTTWTPLHDIDTLTSANARLFVRRLQSGNLLLVFNNDRERKTRKNLTAFLSEDDGKTWPYALVIDERTSVSYPDAIQDNKGFIYVVYDRSRTGEKEILLAKFTEEDVKAGAFRNTKSRKALLLSKPIAR